MRIKIGTLSLVAVCTLLFVLPPHSMADSGPVVAENVMVVTAHPSATQAGVTILEKGGTAVDAAIAVSFALAVSEPYSSGIGGGGFLVVFDQENGDVKTIDAREMAPAFAHRDMYLVDGVPDSDLSCFGPLSVGVPGLVRGLWELHEASGTLPWEDLLAPAILLAENGIQVSPMLHARIRAKQDYFNDAAKDIFLSDGQTPALGSNLVQKDLANTLHMIAAHGWEAFYKGPVAESIVQTSSMPGAGLTMDDMAAYRPVWRDPVHGMYRGRDVYSMAPPSSGGVHLVQMLNILEHFDLQKAGYGSALSSHLMAEAMKFAYADRSLFLGDSDFVSVPVERLSSVAYADSLSALINFESVVDPNTVIGAALDPVESSETTHFSIIDANGNAVAATLTINLTFGSCLVAPGTGIFLNDEMDDFAAAPGHPNAFGLVGSDANSIAPGKRPLSSMTPTIVLEDGKVSMVTGTPGGSRIITTTLQTIIHVIDFEMTAAQAVSVPRIHHQWFPRKLYYEPFGMNPDTQKILRMWGHHLKERSPMGNAQLIVVQPGNQFREGASDPRGMGSAWGY
jgi:gamma-glutamyltranspeptidase / glutathione hydrolase